MDFTEMFSDAWSFTKEGVLHNTNRWANLVLALLCLGIPFNGYLMRVYRGETPAPEVDRWGTLVTDGLKLLVVGIIYALPLLLLWAVIYGTLVLAIISGRLDDSAIAAFVPNMLLMMLFYILEIAIILLLPVAYIRYARTGVFAEALNISAILHTIGEIGWLTYIIALFLVSIVVSIPVLVLVAGFIVFGGISLFILRGAGVFIFLGLLLLLVLLLLILAPLLGVFQARCMTLVYDSTAPAGPVP